MERQIDTFSDKEIQEYLELTAPLENYYIRQNGDDENTSILNVFENGNPYRIMDDNDQRAEKCINFLRKYGASVLKSSEEEDTYIEEFNRRT